MTKPRKPRIVTEGTKAHVGIIRAIRSTETEAVMDADIFDTASGREALEYVKAVLAAGARTGLSVGFRPRRTEWVTIGDKQIERFLEIELSEISITPVTDPYPWPVRVLNWLDDAPTAIRRWLARTLSALATWLKRLATKVAP